MNDTAMEQLDQALIESLEATHAGWRVKKGNNGFVASLGQGRRKVFATGRTASDLEADIIRRTPRRNAGEGKNTTP